MSGFEVRIEELPSLRVAWYRAVGVHPEIEAIGTLEGWADERGIVVERRFGFNNPPPRAADGPEYGYESWIVVGPDVEPDGPVAIKTFPGSLCAVTTISRLADITDAWMHLYRWCKESAEYRTAGLDGLEELLSPVGTPEEELSFHLWLPVRRT